MALKKNTPDITRPQGGALWRNVGMLIAIVWVGIFLFHANKALGFYPLVIPDEYWYTSDLRHRAFSETVYPGYIYYALYSLTGFFGQFFFDAGRVLNALFFSLSAPFIFKLAALVCEKKIALFVTALTLLSPFSGYTAYFMPESLYFTIFWALAWLTIGCPSPSFFKNGIVAGAGIAILSLVKMHALFLLPGYILFILATTPRENFTRFCLDTGWAMGGMVAAFIVIRLGFGFAFAGIGGLNPLGSYAGFVASGTDRPEWLTLIGYGLCSLVGHLIALAVLFILPLILAGIFACGKEARNRASALYRMFFFSISLLIPLLFVTAGYSALFFAGNSDQDNPEILSVNFRYYNFLFPGFIILAAGVLSGVKTNMRLHSRIPAVLLVVGAVVGVYAAIFSYGGYSLFAIPACPELGGLATFPAGLEAGTLLLAAVTALAVLRPGLAAKIYLLAILPLVFVVSTIGVQYQAIYGFGVFPEIYDKGGIFARDHLKERCSDLTVVDSFIYSMTKALIHIDNGDTDMLPQFTREVDVAQVAEGKEWLLVFGGLIVPDRYVESKIVFDDPALTPDLLQLMTARDDFRSMPRYTLIKLKKR